MLHVFSRDYRDFFSMHLQYFIRQRQNVQNTSLDVYKTNFHSIVVILEFFDLSLGKPSGGGA